MVKHPEFFLGIDGGGSKCRARIRNSAGTLLAEAVGGPANVYQDMDAALQTILKTSQEAATRAGLKLEHLHAGMGLAGVVTSVDGDKVLRNALPFAAVTIDNDAAAACIGAFNGGDGGIVIAGTGSIGLAEVGGTRHIVGGWGFALGDHGSGAWAGHHAARRAALVIDGLMQPTPLIEKVMERAGKTRQALSNWSEKATPRDFAQFAPAVFEGAVTGDVHAMFIVVEGAAAISNLGRALLARGARQLCFMGGLSQAYLPFISADMRGALVTPKSDAMDGAIFLARKAAGL